MKDQVDALLRRDIKAAVMNSSLSREEYLTTQKDLREGQLDLLYCAPERLNNEGFVASLKNIPGGIRLLAVDEVRALSQLWSQLLTTHRLGPLHFRMGSLVSTRLS